MSAYDRPERIGWSISASSHPDALDLYREGLAPLYATSDFEGGESAFFNTSVSWRFGATVFGWGKSTGQTFTRSADEIRRSGFDGISIFLDGSVLKADADGRNISTNPGTIHFRDLARPAVSRVTSTDLIVTVIPRETAPDWLLDPAIHGHTIASDTACGRLLAAHLGATCELADQMTRNDGLAAIDAALILAERSVRPAARMTHEQAQSAYRTVRKMAAEVIERKIADPALDANHIAQALGISRATLYRAFEPAGGVMASIQRRRLARAYGLLRLRTDKATTVAQVAYGCGFISESHFSRAFRDRYGCAPGELGGMTPPPTENLHKDGIRHDLFMDWLRSQ